MTDCNEHKIKIEIEKRTRVKIARHIVRLDKDDGGAGTHGWQARWMPKAKQQTKLFSDSLHGGYDGAREAAEEFVASLNLPETKLYYRSNKDRRNKSGTTGVCRGRKDRPDCWTVSVVIGPQGNKYLKRFPIDSAQDEEEALDLAIEYRREWEMAVDKGLKALIKFFEDYEEEL